ncbi:putative Glutamine amidotransferase domain-containing protein [Seiridium unicorne]|uniref:Glutamine amidotransferase domain-containing protein n=1 Tax=Seiridium unicorne TaxID=138068 RepID=A0ABR2VD44_9PEZI
MGAIADKDMTKIRMMVLETDEAHPDTVKERGSFADILHHHLAKAGRDHNPPMGIDTDQRFVVADKGGKVPKFEEFAGIHSVLITGSCFDAHSDKDWVLELLELLKSEFPTIAIIIPWLTPAPDLYTRRPDMKFSGICFGHQLLCRLLGSEIKPEPKGLWELGHSQLNLTRIGKFLFQTDSDKIHLHQMHQDQVVSAPSHESSKGLLTPETRVHVWGSSEHTPIQGVFIANRVFTTQAHLAFDQAMVHRQIEMRVEAGSIQDLEHADQAKETAHLEHDGNIVAAAILRFFHDEDKEVDNMAGS